jgi:hypothetical protein
MGVSSQRALYGSFTQRLDAVLRAFLAGELADVAIVLHPAQQII